METRSTAAWSSAELLAHSSWIRSLALRLVRDAAQAYDRVQDTYLAALQRSPSAERSLRPWLASVLRRRAAFLGRGEARRRALRRAGFRFEAGDYDPAAGRLIGEHGLHAVRFAPAE